MVRVITIKIPEPNEKQKLFLAAKTKHVGFGGARGGGKSWGIRAKATMLSLNYKGIKVLIVRRTYKELWNNHIEPLKASLKGIATYNKTDKVFTFLNGSMIIFGYCNNDGDLDQYQGAEYDVIFLDEATQLDESWIKKITACCRGVNGFPKRIYYTCNPGGRSHGYIKRLFVDRKYEGNEKPEDYTFIQSLVTDNKALMESDPDYVATLENLPPKLREAWLYGSWDIFEGQFFEDFIDNPEHYDDRRWTHVINPLPLEAVRAMKIYRSYDFGYAKPFSCGWWGVDRDGTVYRIAELYGCTKEPNEGVKWDPNKQFAEIARIEREHPYLKGQQIIGVADPSIWDESRGKSIYRFAADNKIYFSKGDNQRIPGWMQMHYRFAFDGEGYPMMYVFNTCKAFIRTIPLQIYSETHIEDLDTDLEDHVADETRYFLMEHQIKPRTKNKETKPEFDPLDLYNEQNNRMFRRY